MPVETVGSGSFGEIAVACNALKGKAPGADPCETERCLTALLELGCMQWHGIVETVTDTTAPRPGVRRTCEGYNQQ